MAYDLYIGLLHKQLSYATANGPWTCATPKIYRIKLYIGPLPV